MLLHTYRPHSQLPSFPPRRSSDLNFIQPGQTTATGQVIRENVNMNHLLERALALSDYRAKTARFARENSGQRRKKGMGLDRKSTRLNSSRGQLVCRLLLEKKTATS